MKVTDIHTDEFYCPNCGSEIAHDMDCELPKYCKECGQRIYRIDEDKHGLKILKKIIVKGRE